MADDLTATIDLSVVVREAEVYWVVRLISEIKKSGVDDVALMGSKLSIIFDLADVIC